ncbi:DUF3325 family protein [Comamonas sp. GB3 AK4-5]|uniref:DUF3325 family protein n=1 Tax=Comamonas sp. GB3 AK4-5 TaxID=3231487 RepID=UPI00351DB120
MLTDFLLCFAAWSALALAMDRHYEEAWPGSDTEAAPIARRRQQLALTGCLLLTLSLSLALTLPTHSSRALAAVVWVVALSLSAVAATAASTWMPQQQPLLGLGALAAGAISLLLRALA